MSKQLIPVAGLIIVLSTALTLIFVVTLRPWASSDSGYDTHLNFQDGTPDGYTRTILTWLDTEAGAPLGWVLRNQAPDVDPGYALYIARGCASCHGLEGAGGVVGDSLDEASKSEIRKSVRKGEGGMPAYHESDLTDEQVALIVGYLLELRAARPTPIPSAVSPQATPTPTILATATSTAVPTLTPTPTPDVAATGTPSSDEGPTPVVEATQTPEATPTSEATPTPTPVEEGVYLTAAAATITVDGDTSDWAAIPGAQVTLQQIQPIPGVGRGELSPIDVTLKVASDSERIYVLVEVPDDYDYVSDDHGLSAAFSVMFRIDEPAAPHMGTTEEEQRKSLGMVDIWYWQLDCGPGQVSGGGGIQGGNDPICNLDDEYATTPEDLEDDGTVKAENSLVGVWEHTARAQGQGADGTWIFEISRPLQTGDPEDVQLSPGMTVHMALSYWDADETPDGWTGAGHLQSSTDGWIEVQLP